MPFLFFRYFSMKNSFPVKRKTPKATIFAEAARNFRPAGIRQDKFGKYAALSSPLH